MTRIEDAKTYAQSRFNIRKSEAKLLMNLGMSGVSILEGMARDPELRSEILSKTPEPLSRFGRKVLSLSKDERPPNLRSQMLEHLLNGLELAENYGFPEVKFDMLRLVSVFTADSLRPDGSLSTRPFTDESTVTRGLQTIHTHFPHLQGIDTYDWLNETQYKALWGAVHSLPLPYDE